MGIKWERALKEGKAPSHFTGSGPEVDDDNGDEDNGWFTLP